MLHTTVVFPLLVTAVHLVLIAFVLLVLAYVNTSSAVSYDEQAAMPVASST